MVLSIWTMREKGRKLELNVEYGGTENYFTLRLPYGGIFSKPPGRKYIEGTVSYKDYVDIDLFSAHELNDMVIELGYQKEQWLYYHYCIPDQLLDFGLMPLGNDSDVLKLITYVPKFRQINVYIELGETRVFTHFKSPSKLVIELQLGLLRDYGLEIQNSNPGTTVKIDVYPESNLLSTTRSFKRIYVCLGALKLGFRPGLRDFLGVDGTFMKGPYPGQVLTAVGMDSNNGIFPLAYAVVEAETTSSWTWFLEILSDDLELGPHANFTFISDQQKGILPAIAKVFSRAEHRYCLRHIQENMKLKFRDTELRDQVWKLGKVTTVNHYNNAMDELRIMNDKCHAWVSKIPAKHWSKSHFSGRAHTDCILNNLCEVFNAKIDKGRDKTIITCLEYIREYLMRRLCAVQQAMNKCHGILTRIAQMLLEEIKKEASKYTAI